MILPCMILPILSPALIEPPLQDPRGSAPILGGSTSGLTHFRGKAAIASKENAVAAKRVGGSPKK
jgi:hypothetical protein